MKDFVRAGGLNRNNAMGPLIYTVLVATVWANPAGACPVRLIPVDAPRQWVSAAAALERTLRDTPAVERDCREVVVHAAPLEKQGPASVEVTTTDGRRGVRALADARDLEPTVAALIVPAPPAVLDGPAAVEHQSVPAPTPTPLQFLLFAGGGGRLSLPGSTAPVLEVMAGAVQGSWELALFGGWAPTVARLSSAQPEYHAMAELGLSAGRRRALQAVDLIAGARASAAALWGIPATDDDTMSGNGTGNFGDGTTTDVRFAPALAAFVGTSIPVLSALRLRPQLSFQWIPIGIGTAGPTSSIWNVGLGVGAESRMP